MTSEFKIKKRVRQGCVLSPNLFNLYTEKVFREVEDMKGVNINNLRYADDTVLLVEGPMFLQALLTAVNARHKYDTTVDFDSLRVVVRSIEHEFKGETGENSDKFEQKKTAKIAALKDEPVSPEVGELRGQIHKLTNTVNSMQQQLAKAEGSEAVAKARAFPSRPTGDNWQTKPKEIEEGAT